MTRLQILEERRFELINTLIELKTWQMSNTEAKIDQSIARIETELDELDGKIKRLRMDK